MRLRLKDPSTGSISGTVQVDASGGGGGPPRRDGDRLLPTGRGRSLALEVLGRSTVAGGVDFNVELPVAMAIRIDLYDVGGRQVARVESSGLAAGASVVHWDARDDGGRPVAAGLYIAQLSTTAGARTVHVVLFRG
jgi:hypothetical protein